LKNGLTKEFEPTGSQIARHICAEWSIKMSSLYPLRFEPIFQRYLWGGTRLASLLNKSCGSERAAESWEIVDYQNFQSKVQYGPLKGSTLGQLMESRGREILGAHGWEKIHRDKVPDSLRGRFPLLLKFLDADQALSVQVHPDDAYAATLQPADLGKTEAWYVLHAEPDSKIYSGLKEGVTREDFAKSIAQGRPAELLHSFTPQVGDTVFIPAGTLHALGAGLIIAEIQQASNTTFRVYDWDRLDSDGKPRPLHIEQALEVADFRSGPRKPVRVAPTSPLTNYQVDPLIECSKFTMRRHRLSEESASIQLEDGNCCRILVVTAGQIGVENDPSQRPLQKGDTILLPASVNETRLTTRREPDGMSEFLEILAECPA
jgi:mannose-6-phosphate isomerase